MDPFIMLKEIVSSADVDVSSDIIRLDIGRLLEENQGFVIFLIRLENMTEVVVKLCIVFVHFEAREEQRFLVNPVQVARDCSEGVTHHQHVEQTNQQ